MWPPAASAIHTLTSGSEMVTRGYVVHILTRHRLDGSSFGSCDERQMDFNSALHRRVALFHVSFDKAQNEIGCRRAFALGEYLKLPQDGLGEFHCGLHDDIIPCQRLTGTAPRRPRRALPIPGAWTEEAMNRILAVAPGVIGIGAARDTTVPVVLEALVAEPTADLDTWQHVVVRLRENTVMARLQFAASLALIPIFALLPHSPALAQVLTAQYDNARTGATLHETTLTPANVNATHFGKIFSYAVDGDVYAQPLYLAGVEIPGKGTHNVIFIATEHNSVYAFDADGNASGPLWRVSFLNSSAGIATVLAGDAACPFIAPEIGITPTPAIDLQTGTLYVLARTKEGAGSLSAGRHAQKLHALAVTTVAEKFGGPVEIKASVKARGAAHAEVAFDPLRELPRAALLLVNGQVYLTWGSSCDVGPYHGWVMA
jgi:hypothetical protein